MAANASSQQTFQPITMKLVSKHVARAILTWHFKVMTPITSVCILQCKISSQLGKLKNFGVRFKSYNSHEWLERRNADIYIELAKRQNYRCRSAFKLIEIIDKFNIIKPGFKVLDVGAAPGSWSQVLAERTNSKKVDPRKPVGMVIAIDLGACQSQEGVITLPNMDFTKKESQDKILEILGGDKFDFIFSDMAPSATVNHLRTGGGCLFKVWDGAENETFKNELNKFFKFLRIVKPKATYKFSSESYLLARDFMGLKK